MKLHIFENNEIVKTYEADTYDLKFGTVEDLADAINLDALKTGSNAEIIKMACKLVMTSMDTVKNLLKDIFTGITDEDLKKTTVKEIAGVFVDIVTYTIAQLNINKSKN